MMSCNTCTIRYQFLQNTSSKMKEEINKKITLGFDSNGHTFAQIKMENWPTTKTRSYHSKLDGHDGF